MASFTLLHREKVNPGIMPASAGPVWRTCLREVAFLPEELSQEARIAVKDVEVRGDEEALQFLLEILCGLNSPVFGETEVLGQFKTYVASIPQPHPLKIDSTLLPFLMTTVKAARTQFISAAGSLSYGQIVRRWLKSYPSSVLWGYGSLGEEIYPWMKEKTRAIMVKRPRALGELPFVVGKPSPEAAAHVIAAPLSDEEVRELARSSFVVDLRERAIQSHPNVKNLADLFREIRDLKSEREQIIPRCREFLADKIREYMDRQQIRPFGWEDVCG